MQYTEISDGLPFSLLLRFFSCYLWLYFHCDFSSSISLSKYLKRLRLCFFFPLPSSILPFPSPCQAAKLLEFCRIGSKTRLFFFGVYVRLLFKQL